LIRRLFTLAFVFSLASGAGVLAPSGALAADPTQRVVRLGFVHPQSPSTAARGVNAFWDHLHELGWVEGKNLVIEARWADGHMERLPALMAEVLGSKVDVLVVYATQAAVAAKNATSTTPIVAAAMGEPLRTGLAASLARPGGNLTGTSVGWAEGIGGKWLELLQEAVPRLSTVAVVFNSDTVIARDLVKELQAIAPTRGLRLQLIEVGEPGALDHAFEQAGRKAQAVLVLPAPIISAHRWQVTALAAKYRLPTMYYLHDYVDAGGLIAYAPDVTVQFRHAADYVDKILKGAKPGELPIEQPTQWTLVVNLKVARALGLNIPQSILLRADEVIR
jgi:putative tryptophan/tyrosine transport system substrate-binding protein